MTDKTCIVLSTDKNFAPYVSTLLRSISANYKGREKLDVIILVPEEMSDKRSWFPFFRNLKIDLRTPARVDSLEFKFATTNITYDFRFPEVTLYRFFMGSTCLEFDKAIYIDADCIVVRDIQPILDYDLGPAPLAAFHEFYLSPDLGDYDYLKDSAYFNSGVLIADLDYWRKNNIENKLLLEAMDLTKNLGTGYFDQDVLNIVFKNKYIPLNANFNYLINNYNLGPKADPIIVHFAGLEKPWNHLAKDDQWTKLWRIYNRM